MAVLGINVKKLCMQNNQTTWRVGDDAAWHKVGPAYYRHYSGVSMIQKRKLWHTLDRDGNASSGYRTSLDAVVSLTKKDLWTLEQFNAFTRVYGKSHHTVTPCAKNRPMFFVLWAPKEEDFPGFVRTTLANHFFGNAKCAGCSSVMTTFQTRTIRQFDGPDDMKRSYIVCDCGYPVWQMEWELYEPASTVMEQRRHKWNRKQNLIKAGGKHTLAEIKHIMDCQKGRCIYCHRLFTDELVASKDHLLPSIAGGSDWALNIVLACQKCNSERCDIPFRTYCTLLSPIQNRRILLNLIRRFMAIDYDKIDDDAFACLQAALAEHDPKHFRYHMMKGRNNRNVKTKQLLPRTSLAILKAYSKEQRQRLRELRTS